MSEHDREAALPDMENRPPVTPDLTAPATVPAPADDDPAPAVAVAVEDAPEAAPPATGAVPLDVATRSPERDFEDLSLAELLSELLRRPRATWPALRQVLAGDVPRETLALRLPADDAPGDLRRSGWDTLLASDTDGLLRLAQVMLFSVAFMLALIGGFVMVSDFNRLRQESIQLVAGAPWVVMALLTWLAGELLPSAPGLPARLRALPLSRWRRGLLRAVPLSLLLFGVLRLLDASDEDVNNVALILSMAVPASSFILAGVLLWLLLDAADWIGRRSGDHAPAKTPPPDLSDADSTDAPADAPWPWYAQPAPWRIMALATGLFLTALVWVGTAGNRFETLTFYLWLAAIASVAAAFAPAGWNALDWARERWQALRGFRITSHNGWIIAALAGILLLGALFRFDRLNGDPALAQAIPPEMTSDHVEKLLDSQRLLEGGRDIFLANNGGREPFNMYLMALWSQLPGQSMSYESLKTLTALQSVLTLPLLFWLGLEVMGRERRRQGILLGLVLAGLIAASYWHTSITRQAERIVLTPFITTLLMIFLARGLRHNRRADFMLAGLCLGFGLYMYQAVRMLPVVIVIMVLLAVYFNARTWQMRLRYIANLAVLVLVSFIVFVPMLHYTVENPEQFFRRTAGRLLGDDIVTDTLADGTIVERYATLPEQLAAFSQNVPVLLNNIRTALLMFNWKGDVAWINGYPNYPALDIFTGGLLLLSLVAWGGLLLRERDIVHWMIPIFVFIMLLPSALSIAYPIENPSFTRTSGAMPAVYLLAAFPLVLFVDRLTQVIPRWPGRALAGGVAVVIILGAYALNSDTYLNRGKFYTTYISSALPYSDAGRVLQGFAISDGGYGNAFMIAYQYWWDHRALGLAAGLVDFPNGIISLGEVPNFMRLAALKQDRYRFDPDKDILFFYSVNDVDTSMQLKTWFPAGRELRYPTYQPGDDFMLYRVPALGAQRFQEFLVRNGVASG
ncbi:MAG: glycosyltransferase family 39 protein [Anaerolineae bacterium]|nr:glycosyltransferase family 39 protein [Anaerolineae bacterium]